jgi:hypothetical protein
MPTNVALTAGASRQFVRCIEVPFDYTNVAETGVSVIAAALPQGAQVVGGHLSVDTAWDTSVTATIDIGDSSSATRFGSAIDLKTAAVTALTITGFANSGGLDIKIKPALSGTAAAAGAGRLLIEFIMSGRVDEYASA